MSEDLKSDILSQRIDALRVELAEHWGREHFCPLCRIARHLDRAYGEAIGEPVEENGGAA